MLCICSFLMLAGLASRGDAVPPWIPLRFRRNRRGYPPLVRTADEAAPPRRGQWYKSPAELDFYGGFYGLALRRGPKMRFAHFTDII